VNNPLRYQVSEYDCGPTCLLNALSYLFRRDDIPPEVVRNIMLYCLDSFGADGREGRNGTSRTAMQFLSVWLDGFGKTGRLPISSTFLTDGDVYLGEYSRIRDALRRGGAAVVRIDLTGWHYVLLTSIEGDEVRLFDPYYMAENTVEGVRFIADRPDAYNRIVSTALLEREVQTPYAFGPVEGREAVLLFNERTRLTEENTVEYFI